MPTLLAALGFAGIALVGFALGLLGAGGSSIALPVLVYLVGMRPPEAVTTSLLLVCIACGLGTLLHWRRGLVCWSSVVSFAPAGILGSLIGSSVSRMLSGRAILLCFSALLIVSGVRMLFDKQTGTGRTVPREWYWVALGALGIGFITGVLGVAGGFVLVPAMIYLAGLEVRRAMATSLAVITINAGSAFLFHAVSKPLPKQDLAPLLLAGAAGMATGVWASHRTAPERLQTLFACVLIALAAYMMVRNF